MISPGHYIITRFVLEPICYYQLSACRSIPINAPTSLKRALYLALVRSHLCFCSQLWRPYKLKEISNYLTTSYKVVIPVIASPGGLD